MKNGFVSAINNAIENGDVIKVELVSDAGVISSEFTPDNIECDGDIVIIYSGIDFIKVYAKDMINEINTWFADYTYGSITIWIY